MTKAELDRWVRRRVAEIDHKLALEKIRSGGAKHREELAEVRRLEEQLTIASNVAGWKLARYHLQVKGKPIEVRTARAYHRTATAGMVLPGTEADVARWRQHADEYIARRKVAVSWAALPATNAYAWPRLNEIETAPIDDADAYAVWEHEKGHNENPCQPTHTRVTTTVKKTCCVRCEITAWQFAQRDALDWTLPMHTHMAESLGTYAKYATPDERAEIAELSGRIGFLRVTLERATEDRRQQ